MRIFQIESFYPNFLSIYHDEESFIKMSFDKKIENLLYSGFSAGHMVTPYLPKFGHEAFTCIANSVPTQRSWIEENVPNKKRKENYSLREVVLMQIEHFRPDIIYATDPTFFDSSMIRSLSYKPDLCVAWRAAPSSKEMDLSLFDLTLTSDESFKSICEGLGARHVRYHYPGHPDWINEKIEGEEKKYDVVFSGQIGPLHKKRTQFLESVIPALLANGIEVGIFALGHFSNGYLQSLNMGPRFGLDMYRTIKQSKIVLNVVIDTASKNGINMRHFEATGVGSLSVDCGARDNLIFEDGVECFCFEKIGECIDSIIYLNEKPSIVEWVSANGFKKCNEEFNMNIQTSKLIDIFYDSM